MYEQITVNAHPLYLYHLLMASGYTFNVNNNFYGSMFPKSTHETFAQKLYQTFAKNQRFIKPKLSRTSFTISHYAGEVIGYISYFFFPRKDQGKKAISYRYMLKS